MSRGVSLVFGPTPVEEAISEIQLQVDNAQGSVSVLGAYRGICRACGRSRGGSTKPAN